MNRSYTLGNSKPTEPLTFQGLPVVGGPSSGEGLNVARLENENQELRAELGRLRQPTAADLRRMLADAEARESVQAMLSQVAPLSADERRTISETTAYPELRAQIRRAQVEDPKRAIELERQLLFMVERDQTAVARAELQRRAAEIIASETD